MHPSRQRLRWIVCDGTSRRDSQRRPSCCSPAVRPRRRAPSRRRRTPATRLRVATTVAPITSIVANVGGDRADVHGHRPRGHELAHVRARAERRRAAFDGRRRLRQRPQARGPDEGARQENLKDGAEIVELGTQTIPPDEYIYDFSFPKDDGKPNPHLWTNPPLRPKLRRDRRATTWRRRDPANAAYYEANYEAFSRQGRPARRGDADVDRHGPRSASCSPTTTRTPTSPRTTAGRCIGAIQVSTSRTRRRRRSPTSSTRSRPRRCRRSSAPRCSRARCSSRSARRPAPKYVDELRDDDLPGAAGRRASTRGSG